MNKEALEKAKEALCLEVSKLQDKYELSKAVSDDHYDPGMMEYLDQFCGSIDGEGNIILRTWSKGLRYDDRSLALERVQVGEKVDLIREPTNIFNSNNFMYKKGQLDLGNMDAALCNAIAPLYDEGVLLVEDCHICFLERLRDRSRYAKQGVLFIEIKLKLIA